MDSAHHASGDHDGRPRAGSDLLGPACPVYAQLSWAGTGQPGLASQTPGHQGGEGPEGNCRGFAVDVAVTISGAAALMCRDVAPDSGDRELSGVAEALLWLRDEEGSDGPAALCYDSTYAANITSGAFRAHKNVDLAKTCRDLYCSEGIHRGQLASGRPGRP